MGKDTIFAGERNDIRDCAESDQVHEGPKVVIGSAGKVGFASSFDDCMSEFESEAD